MAELAISIAEKLIEVIATEAIKEICRLWGYKDELEELSKTINTIKNVLLDADSKRGNLSNTQQGYISELKDVVYDAEDLFDEFHTLVKLGQISGHKGGNKLFGKVRRFFSSKKDKFSRAHKMSRRVEEIKGHLDAIASNYSNFGFKIDYQPIIRRREETCSYVDAKGIIGRDKDKDAIIDSLLSTSGDDKVRFSTIVGVGGLGKTALAQLVYNDEKIFKEFGESSRLWVCVSDQEGVQFDVKTILSKILEVSTKRKPDDSSSMESIKNQFQDNFKGRKIFLVLDDVWNEDHGDWRKLREFLMMFAKGSKILVTSRSEITGNIIGSKHVYRLQCLSEEESQKLFEMSAFEEGEKSFEMVKIGENIVEKCCGIPLAIKVVGSLLYGQGISMWQSIERSDLAGIGNDKSDRILHILKLSYYNLAPSLKRCFSYCAIFPKDYKIDKMLLIGHWMAHGYVVPLVRGQSIDDAAEEYFLILMRRCFFQDIVKDEYGNIRSVKIHDLMHDVAKDVGKEEICVITSEASKLEEKIRHVNFVAGEISLCRSKLRSYICEFGRNSVLDDQVPDLVTLRVLDLSYSHIESLPETIDRLLLLRFLDLTVNFKLEVLPKSITKLYNLQTLILRDCEELKEMPKDICNLTNLRHLDLRGCRRLMDDGEELPGSILKLRNLRVLPYIQALNDISDEEVQILKQLFSRVKGKLRIEDMNWSEHTRNEPVRIYTYDFNWVFPIVVLEKLELSPYISELEFEGYIGKIIPWSAISLTQYLVYVDIYQCEELEQIPVLSTLPNLRYLRLAKLKSLEYMENGISSSSNDKIAAAKLFPSLETLKIYDLPLFKAWWKGDFTGRRLIFPRLHKLIIRNCPKLALNLHCPSILEELELTYNSESLVVTGELEKLRKMEIDHHHHLKLLPPTKNCLICLELTGDIEVESAIEAFQRSCASSLLTLRLIACHKLKRLPRFDHLIALEELSFLYIFDLSICEDDEVTFPQTLRKLEFNFLPKMKSLPKGMQHLIFLQALKLSLLENMEGLPEWMSCLSCLQSLYIENCPGIKTLPQAIKDLTSLDKLRIVFCPLLVERCQNPDGPDYNNIRHIRLKEIC